MFNPLHSNMNQELFEKYLAIIIATMKNTDDFCFEGKPSHACAKSTPFPVSKDEWDTNTTGDFVHENPMKKNVHPVKSKVFIGLHQ